jgi:prepilin-type processing-associated H-X9-DG protein
MGERAVGLLLVIVLLGGPVLSQPGDPAEPAPAAEVPEDIDQMIEMMRAEGAPEEAIMFMKTLASSEDMDPLMLMMLMGMMEGGSPGGGEMMGLLLLSKALGSGSKQPTTVVHDERLFIIEGGKVYRVNLETMELEGSVQYKGGSQPGAMAAILGPVMARAREKARQTSCLSNIKQLCLAVHMYAQDHDEMLPGELWVDEIFPYLNNRAIFTCPARPDLPVGYALNDALLEATLAEIPRPAETAMLFDSDAGGDSPIGGVETAPPEGRHNRGINIGYVDGHAKWHNIANARTVLETIPE